MGIPMMSEETLNQGILRRLQKADPGLATKIEELEQVHLNVTTTFSELMREAAKHTAGRDEHRVRGGRQC